MQGSTFSGTGVYAAVVGSNTTAAALRVSGPALFSRSGILSVPAGQSSSTATGVAMTKASLVLATPQQNRAGVDVQSAVSSVAGNSLTVYLNKPVTKTTKVAWFVVN